VDCRPLTRFDRDTPVVVPAGAARTLPRRGFGDVTELATGERAAVGATEVVATKAVHEGRRFKLGPRVDELLDSYVRRFLKDFSATLPAADRATS
jgi:hypothetical protein